VLSVILAYVLLCTVFRFSACRAADEVDNHVFTLDSCQLTDQVINIQTIEISFSEDWNAADNPPRCNLKSTCANYTKPNEIMNCNGKRSCSFSQTVLNHPPCQGSTNANYIKIEYNCINGNTNVYCLQSMTLCHYFLDIIDNLFTCLQFDINIVVKISRLITIKIFELLNQFML